jgi:hypothetical protein
MEKSITSPVDNRLVHRESLRENCISSLHKLLHTSEGDGTKNKEPMATIKTAVMHNESRIRRA